MATRTKKNTTETPDDNAARLAARTRLLALASSEEFSQLGGEIAGHWAPEEPNLGDPIFVRVLDWLEVPAQNGKEAFNMFAAEFLDGHALIKVGRDETMVERLAEPGEVISFIQTAGLDPLVSQLGGSFVIIPAGMRKVPKGNMKVFDLHQKKAALEPRAVFGRNESSDDDALPPASRDGAPEFRAPADPPF